MHTKQNISMHKKTMLRLNIYNFYLKSFAFIYHPYITQVEQNGVNKFTNVHNIIKFVVRRFCWHIDIVFDLFGLNIRIAEISLYLKQKTWKLKIKKYQRIFLPVFLSHHVPFNLHICIEVFKNMALSSYLLFAKCVWKSLSFLFQQFHKSLRYRRSCK